MSFAGNLATVAFSDILQLLSTGKKTGALCVTRSTQKKEIFFRNGNIISASSTNDDDDLLGHLLVKRGMISAADLERALSLQKATGKKLGASLIELEIINHEQITDCLRMQIEEIVYSLFGWNQGEFIFQEGRIPSGNVLLVELNTMNIIMEGMRRIDEWAQIQKSLPSEEFPLRVVKRPQVKTEGITLSHDEFVILSLVDGKRTVPDIIKESPVGEFITSKALHKLISTGLVEKSNTPRSKLTESLSEDQLFTLVLKIYAAAFAVVARTLQQKIGEAGKRLYHRFQEGPTRGLDQQLQNFVFGNGSFEARELFMSLEQLPKEIRLHALIGGLNRLLAESLKVVGLTLGNSIKKQVLSEIKREAAILCAEAKSLASTYQIETDLANALRLM